MSRSSFFWPELHSSYSNRSWAPVRLKRKRFYLIQVLDFRIGFCLISFYSLKLWINQKQKSLKAILSNWKMFVIKKIAIWVLRVLYPLLGILIIIINRIKDYFLNWLLFLMQRFAENI